MEVIPTRTLTLPTTLSLCAAIWIQVRSVCFCSVGFVDSIVGDLAYEFHIKEIGFHLIQISLLRRRLRMKSDHKTLQNYLHARPRPQVARERVLPGRRRQGSGLTSSRSCPPSRGHPFDAYCDIVPGDWPSPQHFTRLSAQTAPEEQRQRFYHGRRRWDVSPVSHRGFPPFCGMRLQHLALNISQSTGHIEVRLRRRLARSIRWFPEAKVYALNNEAHGTMRRLH
ncbi:hypothetical protein FB45DRAFT_9209 [Roridomyces roridus]|uniref:Uncharacterized protein n=1 Tax=Roridomyces roridus TaxID=1738132 RepID=A0AAD7CIW3_9AGAR|nr:hypothetical protein FB45DRAFT_9209 [Roridomyces roridus]